MSMEEIFGESICTYTREQAHEDGILVDVSGMGCDGPELFKFPVSISIALHLALQNGQGVHKDTYAARLWDVCWMAKCIIQMGTDHRMPGDNDIFFKVIVGSKTLDVWGNIGPDDAGLPCFTFGFPEDR